MEFHITKYLQLSIMQLSNNTVTQPLWNLYFCVSFRWSACLLHLLKGIKIM